MRRKLGFTLVELLVVIAIISILAAIVVPNVADYIRRARMTRAVSEINGAELAITKMLADMDRKTIAQLFANAAVALPETNNLPVATAIANIQDAEAIYTEAMYILLRQGRAGVDPTTLAVGNTGLVMSKDAYDKLGASYMDIGRDPFGNQYQFYAGPLPRTVTTFRGFRAGTEDPGTGDYIPYIYNQQRKNEADAIVPGNPAPDALNGFPAPKTQSIYIYSVGEDLQPNQLHSGTSEPEKRGGGDDINSWDNERGWSSFYN